MSVVVTKTVCLGSVNFDKLTGVPSPVGFIGAGKIEAMC